MQRLVLVAALLGACGSEVDDRPATLEFITETIFAPSCAAAQCHSAFKREVGDQFDTVEATRRSIVANGLVLPADAADPASSFLVRTLTVGVTSLLDPDEGNVRMPYDSPLPDADIELIERWIGEGAHGVQCIANAAGRGCQTAVIDGQPRSQVVECVDGDAGAVVETCALNASCNFSRENGQCVAR